MKCHPNKTYTISKNVNKLCQCFWHGVQSGENKPADVPKSIIDNLFSSAASFVSEAFTNIWPIGFERVNQESLLLSSLGRQHHFDFLGEGLRTSIEIQGSKPDFEYHSDSI